MVPNPNSRKVHLGEGVHRQQLLPGDQLDDVIAKYLDWFKQQLFWKGIADVSMNRPTEQG